MWLELRTWLKRSLFFILWKLGLREPTYLPIVLQNWPSLDRRDRKNKNPWRSTAWVNHVTGKGPQDCVNNHVSPLLALISNAPSRRDILVLDIGGGSGETFRCVRSNVSEDVLPRVRWKVIDGGPLLDAGRVMHNSEVDRNQLEFIDFSETWDTPVRQKDTLTIVFISGTVHYIEEPQKFLGDICKKVSPDYFLITRLPIHVDAPNLAYAIQNVRVGRRTVGRAAVAMFPPQVIESWMADMGYSTVVVEGLLEHEPPSQGYFEAGCDNHDYEDIKLTALMFSKSSNVANTPSWKGL